MGRKRKDRGEPSPELAELVAALANGTPSIEVAARAEALLPAWSAATDTLGQRRLRKLVALLDLAGSRVPLPIPPSPRRVFYRGTIPLAAWKGRHDQLFHNAAWDETGAPGVRTRYRDAERFGLWVVEDDARAHDIDDTLYGLVATIVDHGYRLVDITGRAIHLYIDGFRTPSG